MYRIAIQTFFTNYPLFLMAALALAGIEAVGLDVGIGPSIVVYGLLALYSHRMVLLDETYGWVGSPRLAPGERIPMWAFLWRYGVFFLIFLGFLLVVFIPNMPSDSASESRVISAVLASMVIAAPVFAVILALFGTTLPAAAVNGDLSLGRALQRGRKRFFPTLGRLALGPALITILNLVLALFLLRYTGSAVSAFLVSAAIYFVGFIPTHLTAVALSLAYREAEAASA